MQACVQFIRHLIRSTMIDAFRVADLFEPFSYLLLEQLRLDALLAPEVSQTSVSTADAPYMESVSCSGNSRGHVSQATPGYFTFTSADIAASDTQPSGLVKVAAPLSSTRREASTATVLTGAPCDAHVAAMKALAELVLPPPILSVEACSHILRQYQSSITALKAAIWDVRGADLLPSAAPAAARAVDNHRRATADTTAAASSPITSSLQAPVIAPASRIMSRRTSTGFVSTELSQSVLPLPLTISLDCVVLDCQPVVHMLLDTAYACASRIAAYIDARCALTLKLLAQRYTDLVTMLENKPTTPTELLIADELVDLARMTVAPALQAVCAAAMEDLNFLLHIDVPLGRVELPTPGISASASAAAPHGLASTATIAPASDAAPRRVSMDASSKLHDKVGLQGEDQAATPSASASGPQALQGTDRIAGASIDTLGAAVRVARLQASVSELVVTVSRAQMMVRSQLEGHLREWHATCDSIFMSACADVDRLRSSVDANLHQSFDNVVAMRVIPPQARAMMEEVQRVCQQLHDVRAQRLDVARDEVMLRMNNADTDRRIHAYIASTCSRTPALHDTSDADAAVIVTPWGPSLDHTAGASVVAGMDFSLAPLFTLACFWRVARDTAIVLDKWMSLPVFMLDRTEVELIATDLLQAAGRCQRWFSRPTPALLAVISKALATPVVEAGWLQSTAAISNRTQLLPSRSGHMSMRGPSTEAYTGDSSAGDEVELDLKPLDVARNFNIPVELVSTAEAVVAVLQAVRQRLTGFIKLRLPLILALCAPNVSPSQWEAVNTLLGGKIGPPGPRFKAGGSAGGGGGGGGLAPMQRRADIAAPRAPGMLAPIGSLASGMVSVSSEDLGGELSVGGSFAPTDRFDDFLSGEDVERVADDSDGDSAANSTEGEQYVPSTIHRSDINAAASPATSSRRVTHMGAVSMLTATATPRSSTTTGDHDGGVDAVDSLHSSNLDAVGAVSVSSAVEYDGSYIVPLMTLPAHYDSLLKVVEGNKTVNTLAAYSTTQASGARAMSLQYMIDAYGADDRLADLQAILLQQ
ncbi:MAG: hypothetical protein EOO65_00835 [Methanosarcinales archaeon]|nr:MAG: hypothetical protein EOO65_00835 [Methanosarcinales archaeon]